MSRIDKVNDLIKDEVSKIISEVTEDSLGLITVLRAEVSRDLKKADVWVSILKADSEESFLKIKEKLPEIQKELGFRIKLKYTPKLEFHLDRTGEYAQKIENILKKLKDD